MFGFTGNGECLSVQKTIKVVYSSVSDDFWINSCTTDLESLRSCDLFIVLNNDRQETAFQVEEAQRRGCKAILLEQDIPEIKIPYFIVANVRVAYGILCQKLYGNPADSMFVTAVTGTAGKTCTALLTAGVLAESGNRVGVISSIGIYDGEKMYPATKKTPPANEMAYWFSRMRAAGCTDVVLEVSSDALLKESLSGIVLDAVCLTNLRYQDCPESEEEYRRTELSIFQYAKKEAFAIGNADDPVLHEVMPLINHPLLTVGIEETAELTGTLYERTSGDQTFLLTAGTETIPVRTRVIGDSHILNSMIAAGFGLCRGIDLKKAVRGIERVDNIPGRMERIDCGQPFHVFLDSAQTQEALRTTLRTIREITAGNLYCVFGMEEETDTDRLCQLGKTLELHADQIVLTADSLTADQPEAAIKKILRGMDETRSVRKFRDRTDAISWTLGKIEPEDSLLIVSGSHDLSLDVSDYDVTLSDRAFIKEWLCENQPAYF
ncbi:MAG: hypothetical protein LBQ54_04600 [Planctomycetaceae bacterium]|jgi:UDP-N-acetylmuramoyl-L-alanyl-D-glutamate--2,6-diaminopimelate ligase|nr:hypothetical protein [Planctomycetaceae bacterium]